MTGAVESDAMTTYDVALADDCYRWSCSTFAAWTVLMLAFQRDALAERGVESIVFTLMGLLQTVMSYLGDVVYLKRGAKGEQFYPDVVLATGLIGWACRLHGSEPAFRWSLGVSFVFFASALYLNHGRSDNRWVLCHILWHALPLELYLGLTPPAAGRLDRVLLWTYVWCLVVLRRGGARAFARDSALHDAWAYAAGAGALYLAVDGAAAAAYAAPALAIAAGYFAAVAGCCLVCGRPGLAAYQALTVLILCRCLGDAPRLAPLGARLLLVQCTAPVLGYWRRRDAKHLLGIALVVMGLARCVFLPTVAREILLRSASPAAPHPTLAAVLGVEVAAAAAASPRLAAALAIVVSAQFYRVADLFLLFLHSGDGAFAARHRRASAAAAAAAARNSNAPPAGEDSDGDFDEGPPTPIKGAATPRRSSRLAAKRKST